MRFIDTPLEGIIVIEPDVYEDARGFFMELYHTDKYAKVGLPSRFVQDNFAKSVYGALRGLHYQRRHPQGKLVTAMEGTIFDVAVDIRQESPSFGQWYGVELSAENKRQVYIPPGFAHGYCVLSKTASVVYKCTDFYVPDDERGIIWNDPGVNVSWPISAPLLSSKDQLYGTLAQSLPQLSDSAQER
jgi:dTDP-4-dehydrorhamnose 3,5-epimerase